jgi:hypothetical protein
MLPPLRVSEFSDMYGASVRISSDGERPPNGTEVRYTCVAGCVPLADEKSSWPETVLVPSVNEKSKTVLARLGADETTAAAATTAPKNEFASFVFMATTASGTTY